MSFVDPPAVAAWRHQQARTGFEVVHFRRSGGGWQVVGCTTAVEAGVAWTVDYTLDLDAAWATRRAVVTGRSSMGARRTTLDSIGDGRWHVDGLRAPDLDGCQDVDLESSAMTNALPVHRLDLAVGRRASAPAAYVRAVGLGVDRLEQSYTRLHDDGAHRQFHYKSPAFDFSCQLVFDPSGLVLDYPGIAVRQL
ncbi:MULTISPECIES: putative glycolipid-binding domain-containing protein [unclassified Modestobacter]|uniref:putative glycolipid-binding domain-containing protein n=1 Tax=unclassified Modestobacter TaxID=2643866 RepID=UPI0022AA68C6|nr:MULTISPECIES: putative glycolipid-binding domain-containing protein [unclassified Modestobacter]MCZ2811225.1 putative glycolipid-binding domain-containing protein [Modestobacter sp. VKM Ac-2979]MCZ2840738.1 putative glycolipid-binding domain-containing protein [Modestobacter sp. VKM Ac-2980]MCZ2848028.1 putative glycolipid-binding domain-containing protein [Modestobacter sp. VKM Ac-2978]